MLMKQKNISLSNLFRDHPYKEEIIYLSNIDKDLKDLFLKYPKFRAFRRPRGFEGLIRLITEQQLSVASARAVFLRIKRLMPIFSPKEFLKIRLCEIKGIGEWTAECYMLASLGRKDIWPVKDLGLQTALKEVKNLDLRPNEIEMSEMANSWKPYRSIVANVLWTSHD
jgi:DNA-3-methyladenine glycosylase II